MNKEQLKNLNKKVWNLPYGEKIMRVISSFSITEKTVFYFFAVIFAIAGFSLLYQVNKAFTVTVPDYGGTLTEGVIGSPRFVNPLLAISNTDKDLSSLVYSGLLKVDESGELIPDLAESYSVSPDSLVYTVTLKKNLTFHDGVKITSDDVVFTVEKAQDPNLKSPREANWSGVKVSKVDENTVTFTLKQPYAPFIQNLTMGILPKHIWKSASIEEFPFSQFNIKPIGTGPYKINSITYTGSGLPSEYHLVAFKKYSLGEPYITNLTIKSYQNEKDVIEAYKNGDIESVHSISPKELPNLKIAADEILLSPLPRVFGVFFNQNVAPVLVNKEVRNALNVSVDRKAIVEAVIGGFGQTIDGPIPPQILAENTSTTTQEERIAAAKNILTKAGWKLNDSGIFEKTDSKKNKTTLAFSISTGDAPELKETAYLLQKQWKDIGALVTVKIFEIGDLNQNIIRTRKYDALLFGEIIGRDMDLYPFWHSSGRASPGLNIAMYTNLKADKILENLRKTTDEVDRETYFNNFKKEVKNDTPAVFTYSPYFIYIVPKKVHEVTLGAITNPSERWSGVNKWYIETNDVWKIFTNQDE